MSNYVGRLNIFKVYDNGYSERVVHDNNIVVQGMGYALTRLMTNLGSQDIEDFQVKYFQVGTSSVPHFGDPGFYSLSAALLTQAQWGDDTDIKTKEVDAVWMKDPFTSVASIIHSSVIVGEIPESNITKLSKTGTAFQIVLDKNTANGRSLAEIGLFAKNPEGVEGDRPVMMVYKSFEPIAKQSDFSIVFSWVIEGLDCDECAVIPTFADEYYGVSTTANADRFDYHKLDVYKPKNAVTGGNGALIWLHGGAFVQGDRKEADPIYVRELLKKDITFISASYRLVTPTGSSLPLFTYFNQVNAPSSIYPIFTSAIDSSGVLLPSSLNPYRYPDGITNSFNDVIRIIQYVKHNADKFGIDKNKIFVGGSSAGATLTSWLSMAPDCSANGGGYDAVEDESSRPYGVANGAAITNWMAYYPWQLGRFLYFPQIGSGKPFDMSGSIYMPTGEGVAQDQTGDYVSGSFFSSALRDFPTALQTSLKTLFGSSFGALSFGGKATAAIQFHDWATIPGLKTVYEWREVNPLAKKWYSSYYHASATGGELFSTGLRWGHYDNSSVPSFYSYAGSSVSSLGIGTEKLAFWKIVVPEANVATLNTGLGFVSTDPGTPDTYEVCTLLNTFGATPSAIPEPGVNFDLSTPAGEIIQSSSVGKGSLFVDQELTTGEHDALFGHLLINLLQDTVGGWHSTSSTLDHTQADVYSTPGNIFSVGHSNNVLNRYTKIVNFIVEQLAHTIDYYRQF